MNTDSEKVPPTPRLSFGAWAFAFGPYEDAPWSFEAIARWIAESGYDAIEINGFRPHPHDRDFYTADSIAPLRELVDELGIGVSAYAPDFSSTPPADCPKDDFLGRIDSTLAFCDRIGTSILRMDSVSPPGAFDRERFERITTTWREAAHRAADHGVTITWEFEPGFWLNRPSEVLRAVETVDHPAFTVLFDSSHAYAGAVAGARQGPDPELLEGGVPEYAQLLGDRIGHLHLIDGDGSLHDEDTSNHLPFGEGVLDFDEIIAALPAQGTQLAHWTVDFCYWPRTEVDGVVALDVVRGLRDRALTRQAGSSR